MASINASTPRSTSRSYSLAPAVLSYALAAPPIEVQTASFAPQPATIQLLEAYRSLSWADSPVCSIPLQWPASSVQSFFFSPPAVPPTSAAEMSVRAKLSRSELSEASAGQKRTLLELMTRIRPPDDVINLEDRLYYVLQPSLELLVAQQSLEFPLRPFQFQLEGVAFLYPRVSAVLADEMGLGKTMQAITAARMLLRTAKSRMCSWFAPSPS